MILDFLKSDDAISIPKYKNFDLRFFKNPFNQKIDEIHNDFGGKSFDEIKENDEKSCFSSDSSLKSCSIRSNHFKNFLKEKNKEKLKKCLLCDRNKSKKNFSPPEVSFLTGNLNLNLDIIKNFKFYNPQMNCENLFSNKIKAPPSGKKLFLRNKKKQPTHIL